MAKAKFLIIDDEADIRHGIRVFLKRKGYEVGEAENCREAKEVFASMVPDAVILDYKLPDGNALDLMPQLKEINSTTPIIILTAHGSIDLAVKAVKEGAEHFLTKPVELKTLMEILKRTLENQRIRRKQLANESKSGRFPVDPFIGKSKAIAELREKALKVASTERPVLIQGETGTGKGVLASWLHKNGPRADEPFVDLNCAGLSKEFLESELFGHARGAFTGAVNEKKGLFEVAHQGTLFLDEIGDVAMDIQPKLLKVLEEKKFRKLGEVRERHSDVHLIAAVNQKIEELVQQNKFRQDLYFRINTIPISITPLRERPEDISLLVDYFLKLITGELGRSEIGLLPEAEEKLKSYSWPGNIRELKNVIERALLLTEKDTLAAGDFQFDVAHIPTSSSKDYKLSLDEIEREHILKVLQNEKGNIARSAEILCIQRATLYRKIKKHKIDLSEF